MSPFYNKSIFQERPLPIILICLGFIFFDL
jgi:hypothetical protein